jgi:hypothetical protein
MKLAEAASLLRCHIASSSLMWKHRIRRSRLKKYHLAHQGQVAIIIGNGPSVSIDKLTTFQPYVTFTCNRFNLCYGSTKFRPNYTVIVDPQMTTDFGAEIHTKSDCIVFSSDPALSDEFKNGEFVALYNGFPFSFRGPNVDSYIHSGHSVVVSAIQLAFYMGVKEVYLYGVDHRFEVNEDTRDSQGRVIGEQNHFIDHYRNGHAWYPPDLAVIEDAFIKCTQFLQESDVKFANLTPDSALSCVKLEKLDTFLAEQQA